MAVFIQRTAGVGVLPLATAINYAVSGPILRASGLRLDLRRVDNYSVYPALEFEIPIGEGLVGKVGDCWDRNWVRVQECKESIKIIAQCLDFLAKEGKRVTGFHSASNGAQKGADTCQDCYTRAENPRGELGFFFRSTTNSDIPCRCKARTPSFANLAVLPQIAKGYTLADLVANFRLYGYSSRRNRPMMANQALVIPSYTWVQVLDFLAHLSNL